MCFWPVQIITYPIHDLNGTLLVPTGTELSADFMAELCASNTNRYEIVPLLQHKTILKDLLRQFTIPPYNVIFSQDKATLTVLDVMERVRLPLPILEAMDYFREKDFHTYRHILMISALSTLILQEIDPQYSQLYEEELAHFGPSHDIGKITTPVEVLLKKTPLTHGEFDLLKNHALAGYVLQQEQHLNFDFLPARKNATTSTHSILVPSRSRPCPEGEYDIYVTIKEVKDGLSVDCRR